MLTEGTKYDEGKVRLDLLPVGALWELGRVYTYGATKYAERNWEKGLRYSRVFGALLRHLWTWWRGERDDAENRCHHLASVAWCALALLHYELHPGYGEYDDRPLYPDKARGPGPESHKDALLEAYKKIYTPHHS